VTETPALEMVGISKRFGALSALEDARIVVRRGTVHGLPGENGAGKTTPIKAIGGLVKLKAGSIRVFGHHNVTQWREARRLIGLAPQEYNVDRYLSIRDVLIYQAGYYGLRPRDVSDRADMLLEQFALTSKARLEYTKLSGGQKRRLTLARALIHSPRFLILDEPTAGVDVELRLELWELLRRLNREGMTIFLTTHYLEEAEALCRNLGIIREGKLVALEPTQQLLDREGKRLQEIFLELTRS